MIIVRRYVRECVVSYSLESGTDTQIV